MSEYDYVDKDYYAALGVSKDAPQAEIAKAYRKLARELHPDARPGDAAAEERFKQVSEAYAVLSNAEKRAEYDRVREMVAAGARSTPFGGAATGPAGDMWGFGVEDLFGDLLGQARQPRGQRHRTVRRPRRGGDIEATVTLEFTEALSGATKKIRITAPDICGECGGAGSSPDAGTTGCATCGGVGVLRRRDGGVTMSATCPACGGSGVSPGSPCRRCGGTGRHVRTKDVRMRVPAGVQDSARIRVKGKGEAGLDGGPAGDLYVTIRVSPHEVFTRRGDDLTVTAPVTVTEAILGTTITVPTLDEPVTVRVPAGSQPGRVLRVRGKGAPTSGGRSGDLLVALDVVVPRQLSPEQRRLVESLHGTLTSPREHLENYVKASRP